MPNCYYVKDAYESKPRKNETMEKYICRVKTPVPWLLSQFKRDNAWFNVGVYHYVTEGKILYFVRKDNMHVGTIEKIFFEGKYILRIRADWERVPLGYPNFTQQKDPE